MFEDFHFQSLHHAVEPLVLELAPDSDLQHIYVRIAPDDIATTLASLEQTWTEVGFGLPFRFSFLDEDIEHQYRLELRWGRIVRIGAGLATLVAALGALALTSLAAARRTREIGVRKALGALMANVVSLLSRDFAWLCLVASMVALPTGVLRLRTLARFLCLACGSRSDSLCGRHVACRHVDIGRRLLPGANGQPGQPSGLPSSRVSWLPTD